MPATTTTALAVLAGGSAAGATAASMWMGVPLHGAILVGNVCGAFIYLLETEESHRWKKYLYWFLSLVLGYGVAPSIALRISWLPDMLAGALVSALVVVVMTALFKQATKSAPDIARSIGTAAKNRVDQFTGGDHDNQ
ncbi:putative holin [Paraburkholderia sp. J11-2]|uniref:putative holin n=1 Tax=Paraburkholderia sp. J11-2 TaxID=2805431 RepID=UPI002AB74EF5|nr:putative holin [Paraburkholderia sp. J11-2]